MPKYRKKPVIVEAEPYRPGLQDGFKVFQPEHPNVGTTYMTTAEYEDYERRHAIAFPDDAQPFLTILCPVIFTLEGFHEITPGDYIITGVKGERYPCKPDVFALTYEPVGEPEACAEVKWFAQKMMEQLQANESKGGWRNCQPGYLRDMVDDQGDELWDAMSGAVEDGWLAYTPEATPERFAEIVHRAVNVANYVMMIADLAQRELELRAGR